MNNRKGFTLVEAMVSLLLMLIIMAGIFMMIQFYRDVSGTEQARVRQTQESRFLMSVFSTELKNAGSVLTLANSGSFLKGASYFSGIYPLNNTNYPDGVIVASGDPGGVSRLITAHNPTSDGTTLQVISAVSAVSSTWRVNDRGIIIGGNGIYVFKVASLSPAPPAPPANAQPPVTITMDATPVYYSGLLKNAATVSARFAYDDPEGTAGNNVSYPVGAPVVRLDEFSIYLINERLDATKGRFVRELVRVSDCRGQADVLADASTAVKGVIAENVWDMQLVYGVYPANFPASTARVDYFSSGGPNDLAALLSEINFKNFKEIAVNVLVLTDDYPGRGKRSMQMPRLADSGASETLSGKFNYRTFTFTVQPRNYINKI